LINKILEPAINCIHRYLITFDFIIYRAENRGMLMTDLGKHFEA